MKKELICYSELNFTKILTGSTCMHAKSGPQPKFANYYMLMGFFNYAMFHSSNVAKNWLPSLPMCPARRSSTVYLVPFLSSLSSICLKECAKTRFIGI